LRLKTLAAAAFFWILYFLLLKKEYLVRRDSSQKPSGKLARSVLLNFYTELKHALALTAIQMLAIILTAASLLLTILLSA
jgi:hypothetical protein